MDLQPTYDNLPWELIVSALQGTLAPDDDRQFRQWLAVSPENQQKYDQLRQMWNEGLAGYAFYREADEVKAWDSLRGRIGMDAGDRANEDEALREETPVMRIAFKKRAPSIARLLAVAAVLLLVVGSGWWWMSGRSAGPQYETAANEEKKISLPDGSTILLKPQTTVQLAGSYNKASRTVILSGGEAYFEVSHQGQLPFIVDMGAASIKDIGTSFAVQRTKDSIRVVIFSGKVAFTEKKTGETRELSAGSTLCFYISEHRFGEIRPADEVSGGGTSLKFDNSPLSDVIAILQKVSGKKIVLNDTAIGKKRLTAHLDEESFDNALKVICSSLNLDYTERNGVYILKVKDTVAH